MSNGSLVERRQAEIAYYKSLYEEPRYNRGSVRREVTNGVIVDYGSDEAWKEWLDVGCGAFRIQTLTGVRVTRVDPAHPDADYPTPIHELEAMFGKGSFDVVSAFDVLEHLLPEEIDEGILNLWACTGHRLLLSVGTNDGGWWGRDRPAHLTQQPMGWWRDLLAKTCETSAEHITTCYATKSPFFLLRKS